MVLDSTTKSLQFVLGSTATNQLPVVASWSDMSGSTVTPGSATTQTNNTTAVTFVSAPASGVQRQITEIAIYNADTASATVKVVFNDNSSLRTMVNVTLQPGETLQYTANAWSAVDTLGRSQIATSESGTAGGDLTGAYPNPTVAKVNGVSVSGTPTSGQAIVATSSTAASWQTIDTSDFVTLDTTQSITGNKTFTGSVTSHTIAPSANNTYDLGSTSDYYNNSYISVQNANSGATIDGTAASGRVVVNTNDSTNVGGFIVNNSFHPSGFGYVPVFQAFGTNPNGYVQFRVGKDASTNNSAEFNFLYGTSGDANNSFSFGLFGNADVMKLDGNGHIWLQGGTGAPVEIQDGKNVQVGTTTGTKIGTTGGATGQKLAFYGATPITQPVLATGASHTVDDVITALQSLGLVRQS